MGKIWFVVIAVFLISAGVYLKYQAPNSEFATVNAIELNLHNAPNASATSRLRTMVNGKLKEITLLQGTRVRIVERLDSGWDKIAFKALGNTGNPSTDEMTGFVSSQFQSRIEPPMSTENIGVAPASASPRLSTLEATPHANLVAAQYQPNDTDVTQAIINYWKIGDEQTLREKTDAVNDYYNKWATLKCALINDSTHQGRENWPNWPSVDGWYSFSGPSYKQFVYRGPFSSSAACGSDTMSRDGNYQKLQDDVSGFVFRVQQYAISVESVNNYEGNIISYVTFRRLGTDETERAKVRMRIQSGQLVVVDMAE